MRIHRLQATAFGPFPDEVTVDFDALTASGLFLIHGPTGAGKTSLLDAICFALFADIPGVRDRRGIVSDHAAPTATPSVELEFTCGTRRFLLMRKPAHVRPKKRGTGTIESPATVSLSEQEGEGWRVLSTRNDEAAEVINDVLGLGKEQFAKVAMLPQGEFAAFLTAKDDERRALLEKLFDITRFADVEEWLVDQRRASEAAVAAVRAGIDTDLARLADVVAVSGLTGPSDDAVEPQDLGGDGPCVDDSPDAIRARLHAIGSELDARLSEAMVALDVAQSEESLAARAAERTRGLVTLRSRATAARTALAELDAAAEDIALVRAAHDEGRRAAGVRGHLDAVLRAETDVDRLGDLVEQRSSRVLTDIPGATDPAAVLADLVVHDDTVRELVRLERQVASRADLARVQQQAVERAGQVLATADADRAAAQTRAAEAAAEVAAAAEAAAALDGAVAAADDARRRLRLAERVVADETTVARLTEAASDARTAAQDARDAEQDLVGRRLEQMAAELAEGLVDGDSCPVCGSQEHPTPATGSGRVTPEELEAARSRHSALVVEHQRAESAAASGRALLTDALETLGVAAPRELDLDAEAAIVALADQRRDDLRRRAGGRARHETAQAAARAEAARIDEAVAEACRALAQATTLVEQAVEAQAADVAEASRLTESHAPCPCRRSHDVDTVDEAPSAEATSQRHRRLVDQVTGWAEAAERHGTAVARHQESVQAATAAAIEAGFESVEDAARAMVAPTMLERLGDRVRDHDRARSAAQAVLDDPDVQAAEAAPEPDLDAVVTAAQQARTVLLEAQSRQARVASATTSFASVRSSLTAGLDAAGPMLERHHRVKDLADTFAGGGINNTLRMRLTSYVLAARLEKVAQLANERLRVMGDGRYRLEHSDRLAARGARSGLGLRVLDQWTGVTRETSTLSGGEAFMASLALALGLADAVREESGGFDLGTLFVDEGFGTLDDESLEQVITVLDSLREGGRAVGVVSHVGELRSRITSQLVVRKTASGSTVAVSAPGAESAA
ncbi:AAA family ATPase [Knoellia sp. CPCC 206450]|uniref:AAA family ATPase n=1 Tax=Knoellia tibetensis TaxID=3404798 RepID=UPI003B42CCBF